MASKFKNVSEELKKSMRLKLTASSIVHEKSSSHTTHSAQKQ